MRRALTPLLFEDEDPEGACADRNTPVQKAEPSDIEEGNTASRTTPVQSMADLLSNLGGMTLKEVNLLSQPDTRFIVNSEPTELQAQPFALLVLPHMPRVYNRLKV